MKLVLLLLLAVSIMLDCQDAKHNSNGKSAQVQKSVSNSQCAPSGTFNRQDTIGTFKGPVVHFSDTSAGSASGGVTIKDQSGDSISFLFSYGETKNIDLKKLSIGSCVEINFHAQIFKEEGIEINRLFFIDDIGYQ